MANQLGAINHIVVLALENRSFDQMLGFLYTDAAGKIIAPRGQAYEGLTGNESNPDGKGKQVKVFKITPSTRNAYFMPGTDPGERYYEVNEQLFGTRGNPPSPPVAKNNGFVVNYASWIPQRAKRPDFPPYPGTVPENIMGMFPPEMLPIMSGLARGYAVCDHWFSSVPTMTMPNRCFMCAATSRGRMTDYPKMSPFIHAGSIFGRLTDAKLPWAIYAAGKDLYTRTDFLDTLNAPNPKSCFGTLSDFETAAAAGGLPAFSFIEPDWGKTGNSQHPNYDVAAGEQLIHDVYYALRNGKNWNQTLLVITYDEHGGNYDHVPPPLGAVPPGDGAIGELGFDFTRFGVRVPALLISPLVEQGTVFRVPDGTMPLDHTSILKTVEKRWKLIPLTARDAAAPDVGDVLTRTPAQARTDDPIAGVKVPKSGQTVSASTQPSPFQRELATAVSTLHVEDAKGRSKDVMPKLRTAKEYSQYIKKRMSDWTKSEERREAATPKRKPPKPPTAPQLTVGPARVVILRHGEKPADPRNPDLSPAGEKRADMLATAIPKIFGRPDFLFASAPSRDSNRPVETLTPLARALTMRIDTSIADSGYATLAAELFEKPDYVSKLVVVCWHHGNIPDLALALKVRESQIDNKEGMKGMHWEPSVFDLFWSIAFANGSPTLTVIKQPPVPA